MNITITSPSDPLVYQIDTIFLKKTFAVDLKEDLLKRLRTIRETDETIIKTLKTISFEYKTIASMAKHSWRLILSGAMILGTGLGIGLLSSSLLNSAIRLTVCATGLILAGTGGATIGFTLENLSFLNTISTAYQSEADRADRYIKAIQAAKESSKRSAEIRIVYNMKKQQDRLYILNFS